MKSRRNPAFRLIPSSRGFQLPARRHRHHHLRQRLRDAICDIHPAGKDLHLTATTPTPVIAGNGAARVLIIGSSVSPPTVPEKDAGTFSYTRRKPSLTGLTYTCQSSTTLHGWTDFTPANESSDNGDPVETITVTLPNTVFAEPKLFLRVVASQA